jgi:hypothetical protein
MAVESRGRPIFVLGPPRSGTTLLGLMLHAHPRIAIPPENRFVLPAYFRRERFGDLSRPEGRRLLAEEIVGSRLFGDLGLDPQWVTDRVMATGWSVGTAVGLVLRAYADRFGKVRWGDKRPVYRKYLWVIERLFPDAQFVSTVRDGRDCVASMAAVPTWREDTDPNRRIREWMESVQYAEAARERLPQDSFYEVRYETLVTEPEKQLRGLCDFLGEPFDEAMLTPQEVADQVVPDRKVWHAKTRQEVSPSSIGSFTERLTEPELRACETIMADRLHDRGYELSGAGPASDEQLEAYARLDAERDRRLRRQHANDRERTYPWPVADTAGSEQWIGHTVADLERRVAELETETTTLVAERDAARARLDRVLRSRAWRWTKPLRAARRAPPRER